MLKEIRGIEIINKEQDAIKILIPILSRSAKDPNEIS